MKKTSLLLHALAKYAAGLLLIGILLFLPAGTLHYPAAWRFMLLLFPPMLLLGAVLFLKAPALLEKRLSARESMQSQRLVVGLSGLGFVLGFVLAALDFRFGWSCVPKEIQFAASALLLISYALYGEVMRENAYLSRVVEVQSEQKVIDTGLYGIVRHPMYTVTILLFLSIPLVLGSWIALAPFCCYPLLIIVRIRGEEQLLSAQLPGYDAYMDKVKYKLIPFIW